MLKQFECYIELEYYVDEIINRNLTLIKVDKEFANLKEYLEKNMNNKTVIYKRRIVKRITRNLVLLDSPFPYPTSSYKEFLSPIKSKEIETKSHSFHLIIFDDYIYCYKCEFLTFYEIGDSLFIVS